MTEKEAFQHAARLWNLVRKYLEENLDLSPEAYYLPVGRLKKRVVEKNNLDEFKNNCPFCEFVGNTEYGDLNCNICPGLPLWDREDHYDPFLSCERSDTSPYSKLLRIFDDCEVTTEQVVFNLIDDIINFCEKGALKCR